MNYKQFSQQNFHLSPLQRRLNYANKCIKDPLILAENVPIWPNGSFPKIIFPKKKCIISCYSESQGQNELREAICAREKKMYNISNIHYDCVLITNGGFHAVSLISKFLYKPGAIACFCIPAVKNIGNILKSNGYEVHNFFLKKGCIDVDWIKKIAQQRPSLIYVNFPNNPTGTICTRSEIEKLIQLSIQEENINIVFDNVYDSFAFCNEDKIFSPLEITDSWSKLFVINSMSKNFGAPGLRVGWVISDFSNIKKLTSCLESECISVNNIAQQQAACLLERGNDELVEKVNFDRVFLEKQLAKIPGVTFCVPEGGTTILLEMPVDDIETFADFMLENYGLVLATSSNYVGVDKPCLRIPIGQARLNISRAVTMLRQGLSGWEIVF